jgi:hypothetical protein
MNPPNKASRNLCNRIPEKDLARLEAAYDRQYFNLGSSAVIGRL